MGDQDSSVSAVLTWAVGAFLAWTAGVVILSRFL